MQAKRIESFFLKVKQTRKFKVKFITLLILQKHRHRFCWCVGQYVECVCAGGGGGDS